MKTVDFSETIAASDLKVSRSRHLIEYMKIQSNLSEASSKGILQNCLLKTGACLMEVKFGTLNFWKIISSLCPLF